MLCRTHTLILFCTVVLYVPFLCFFVCVCVCVRLCVCACVHVCICRYLFDVCESTVVENSNERSASCILPRMPNLRLRLHSPQEVDLDDASSSCSSLSARTQGSAMSVGAVSSGSYRSRTLPRPSSQSAGAGGGGGGVEEEDFLKAFSDTPSVTVSV